MPDFPFTPEKVGNFCRKCCSIENIQLTYNAGPSTGHCCDAAIFTAYVFIDSSQQSLLGTVNLNNGDTCEEKYVTLTVTEQQIDQMTRNLDDDSCCRFYVQLTCSVSGNQGFGDGQCHTGIAQLIATKVNDQGQTITVFSGTAAESAILIDACSL